MFTCSSSLLKIPNNRRVRTHEKNSGDTVRRLGTIIQSIFCAQSEASNRLTVWKWSGESRYPGAFPPVLENFCRAFSPGPTDSPWVSEDGVYAYKYSFLPHRHLCGTVYSIYCCYRSVFASFKLHSQNLSSCHHLLHSLLCHPLPH